jgi:hypothetical protein
MLWYLEPGLYFGSQVAWLHALGQNIMVAGAGDKRHSSPHGRQEATSEEGTRGNL